MKPATTILSTPIPDKTPRVERGIGQSVKESIEILFYAQPFMIEGRA
jgi:hypothetical protein